MKICHFFCVLALVVSTIGAFVKSTDNSVHVVGRYLTLGENIKFDWPGIELYFEFSGTAVSCIMENSGENFFNIFLDGDLIQVLQTLPNQTHYSLISGAINSQHTLLMTKRTEPLVGTTTLHGFNVDGIGIPFVRNYFAPLKRIEFIGDSLTCGYGDEGVYPCRFSPATENNYL
jgi:hypothetical protein